MASTTWAIYAESASESASSHGHKAKTPIIAGVISGACVGVAWIIGFIVYCYKRHRREKRARALGFKNHRQMLDPPKKPEAFIIPPDPAIVEGQLLPGDRVFNEMEVEDGEALRHAHTIPLAKKEREIGKERKGDAHRSTSPRRPPVIHTTTSSPPRVHDASETTTDTVIPTSTTPETSPLLHHPAHNRLNALPNIRETASGERGSEDS